MIDEREAAEMGWKMYVDTRNGIPVGYMYGPEWKAQELLMEGGYPTPEEAKLAWSREWENRRKK